MQWHSGVCLSPLKPVMLFAVPAGLGGAATGAWDLVRMWRGRGLTVSLIAQLPLSGHWTAALEAVGVRVYVAGDGPLESIPNLPESICVGYCDNDFLLSAVRLRRLGCRLVWANCMTWLFPHEAMLYSRGFKLDAHVFHEKVQRASLERQLARYDYSAKQGHLIHGPFHFEDWPFEPQPRKEKAAFIVGRLARPDLGKWSRKTWAIYEQIRHPRRRAVVMGVDDRIRRWIGLAPTWAQALAPCALPARDFYRRLHCLMPINFSAQESWPRVGLEAMAVGVPIVAPRQAGWCDMITHGENGFLASTPEEFADLGTQLANDEPLRQRIAIQARLKLEQELANPDPIWSGWQRLFASLS